MSGPHGIAALRVLMVEDEELFTDLLTRALASVDRLKLVGTARDGREALSLAEVLAPDVVILDIELGAEPNGIAVGAQIRASRPNTGIVLLTNHKDRQYVASLSEDHAAGWSYLLKQSIRDVGSLVRAVEGAAAGMVYIDQEVLETLRPREGTKVGRLSDRQRGILNLISLGHNDEGIAREMGMEAGLVAEEIVRILRGLEIDDDGPVHPRVKAVLVYQNETRIE
jgi:DNA-binding NarL/FixJ family response regulator